MSDLENNDEFEEIPLDSGDEDEEEEEEVDQGEVELGSQDTDEEDLEEEEEEEVRRIVFQKQENWLSFN